MAINARLLARVQAKMKAQQEAKAGTGGTPGFFNKKDGEEKANGKFVTDFRVLPTSLDPEENDFLKDIHLHYNIDGKNPFICLKRQYGEPCPACDTCSDLWNEVKATGAKKGDLLYEEAKKFIPTQRFFSPGIVRRNRITVEAENNGGTAEMTPEWLPYSEARQMEFVEWLGDDEIGDFTDPLTGTDVRVTFETPTRVKNQYGKVSFKTHPKIGTKLGTKKEVQKLIDAIPDLMSLHRRLSEQEIRDVLERYANTDPDGGRSETKYGDSSEKETTEVDETADDVDKALADLQGA